jgi:hypothetical protein
MIVPSLMPVSTLMNIDFWLLLPLNDQLASFVP